MNILLQLLIVVLLLLPVICESEHTCLQQSFNRIRREVSYEHSEELATLNDLQTENYVAMFSGSELIRYYSIPLSLKTFSIEFWVRLEGGQIDKVPFIKVHNHCATVDGISYAVVGVKEIEMEKDLRIYFELRTEMSLKKSTITARQTIEVHKWFHIAALYDGISMELYVNQAKVSASFEQKGAFLINAFRSCTSIEVGGDVDSHTTFRGLIDKIIIWKIAKTHSEIKRNFENKDSNGLKNLTVLYEEFNVKSNLNYYGVTGLLPKLIKFHIPKEQNDIRIEIPKCGFTVCDNPEVIQSYAKKENMLLLKKSLSYRVVMISNDDGSDPIVSEKQIKQNDRDLNQIFSRYNITWRLKIHEVRNSALRKKTVVLSCYGQCPNDCKSEKKLLECEKPCDDKSIANNICNPECNKQFGSNDFDKKSSKDWDGGDCCNASITDLTKTCYDPESHNRAFIKETELKSFVNLDNKFYLNLFPLKIKNEMLGKSTFPWVPEALGIQGGTIVSSKRFGRPHNSNINDIVHELGHNLGLWHVHKGVSEIYSCDDKCAETKPSMINGDLCDDTNPTPINLSCQDEVYDKKCSLFRYKNTPYKNYMGYSSGSCANEFTIQQQARMHCYIDRNYQLLLEHDGISPSTLPLAPRVLSSSNGKLVITWIAPIGFGKKYIKHECSMCTPDSHSLKQFASQAFSPQYSKNDYGKFTANQATGPPDVIGLCNADAHAWLPTVDCKMVDCYLDVYFDNKVIPSSIKIWVTFRSKNSIKDIELFHPDNSSTLLGPGTAHCDIPYTRSINCHKIVLFVRIHVGDQKPAIDAVQLISKINQHHCKKCERLALKYYVYRQPPFKNGAYREVKELRFKDEIQNNVEYKYQIQSVSGKYKSHLSPSLIFNSKYGFCGDGVIDEEIGEECDDGNLRNNDGCNTQCKIETTFNCKLQPSLCYVYESDGICEDFEKSQTSHDCGYFTPKGFIDQWADNVIGKPGQSNKACSENVISGKPPIELKCVPYIEEINSLMAWRSCKKNPKNTYLWVEASYKREVVASAVVIYFASDGSGLVGGKTPSIIIELKNIKGEYHSITGTKSVDVRCGNSPLVVHVIKNMTALAFKTVAVRIQFSAVYSNLAISAIALRSKDTELNYACANNQLYDPHAKKCQKVQLEVFLCRPFHMDHANATCTGNSEGDKCQINCNNGYGPQVTFVSTCKSGEWKAPYYCKPIVCGTPQIKHAILSCSLKTAGSVCSFKCKPGNLLFGNNTQITCQIDRTWTKPQAFCFSTCSPSIQVENAIPYLSGESGSSCNVPEGNYHIEMGTRCRFQCKPGHRPLRNIPGSVNGGNTINTMCGEDRQWIQDGVCEKITCPKLSDYFKLMYNCTNENKYGSVCKTNCLGTINFTTSTKCMENGEWSEVFSVCRSSGFCEAFENSSVIDTSLCKSFQVGSVCRPICFTEENSVQDIIFKDNSNFTIDVALYCMPNKKWLPPLHSFECVQPCMHQYIKDGFCDCPYNTKHCGYDGGDCCKKTLKAKVNYLFVSSPKCDCVDPVALKMLQVERITGKGSEQSVDYSDKVEELDEEEEGDEDL